MKQPRLMAEPPLSERDSVLREVGQVLALARSVSLGPAFDDIIRAAVESATDRLMTATRRRTARLAALFAIQQTVVAGFDLPAIMAGVYEHLREILDAPLFLVASYDPDTDTVHGAFAVVDGKAVTDGLLPSMPLGDGLMCQVVRGGQPRIVNDLLTEGPAGAHRPLVIGEASQPPRAALLVPMRKGDDVIGVMQVQSYRTDAYGPEEVEFLATIANQTAMAMENARLYAEALRRNREVEALLSAAQELGAELEPGAVLCRVVEAAAHLVDAVLGGIGLLTPPAGRGQDSSGAFDSPDLLTLCTGAGLHFDRVWQDGTWRQLSCPVALTTDGFACQSGHTKQDPCSASLPPLTSRLVVPVLGRDRRPLGVIALFNKRTGDGFTPHDVEITTAFASHAALALERANAYRAVEQSRNYLQALMEQTNAAVMVLDPVDGRLREINAAGTQLLGRARNELADARVFDLAPMEDRTAWQAVLRDAPAGGSVQHEVRILARDGTAIPLDVAATRLDVDDAPAIVCLARDQRPRIRREEAERLRALGEMASGVAHDFNNMLGVILGRTTLLQSRVELAGPGAETDLAVIRQAALDGAETVKRLQAFSGVARFSRDEVADVRRVLVDAVEFTRPRWKDAAHQRGVTIEVAAEPGDTPPAAGGAPELREVLVNMIFNAVDAMPHGGTITLRSWAEGDRVFITVADTGIGMSEAVRSRIFEPFFTTKGARGTGLGLSASYGIVARLGGSIAVDSAPGHGTTFTIELPAGQAPAVEDTAPDTTTGPLTLLLVDDEPQMLRTAQLMLEMEGHQVTAVAGGRAALAALDQGGFDAVLTDLGMPEINGLQLTEMIRDRGYTGPILLTTGWGMELEAERIHAIGVTDILPKPFDGERLRAKLAGLAASIRHTQTPALAGGER